MITAVALLLVASPASAYQLGGRAWPTRTITYHAGHVYPFAVRHAVRTWNTSGVRIRFR